MRTLLLVILAAAIGALAAAQITGALRQRDAYPRGVMDVMAYHAGALDLSLRTQHCAADETGKDFSMLEAMSGDIPRAFPDLMQDKRFAKLASDAHSFDREVRTAPPTECAGLRKTLAQLSQHCDACHREYR